MPVAIGIRNIDIPVFGSILGSVRTYMAIEVFVPEID